MFNDFGEAFDLAQRWLCQERNLAAEHLMASDRKALGRADRIRLAAWPAPFAVLMYALACWMVGLAGTTRSSGSSPKPCSRSNS
jgi:hypothetical protein